MRLVLLGPPGAGKGTMAEVLSQDLSAPHISTGDMLRDAIKHETPFGLQAKGYMDKGMLVPDEVVVAMVADRLKKPDAKAGFILDGFPRTPDQGDKLEKTLHDLHMPLDFVLYLKTSLPVIIRRLSGRRVCEQCGHNFHLTNYPPKKAGLCDLCGGKLIQRPDDHEGTVEKRLKVYEDQTAPLIDYYRRKGLLAEMSGDLDIEPLHTVMKALFQTKRRAARA